MTSQEIQESFKKYNEHFGKFNEIENKFHFNKKLCAMLKIASYFEKNPSEFVFDTRDGEMFLPVSPCITDEDVLYLVRCGVWFDFVQDSFCILV